MRLAVGLLGPLEFQRDGRRIDTPVGRQRTVLAMLLLEAPAVVGRGRLTTELWHGVPPASAAANLRTYMSGVRAWWVEAVGPPPSGADPLGGRDGGWLLDLPAGVTLDLDVHRFDLELAAGEQAARRGDLPAAARHFVRALGVYRGRPLQDVPQGPLLTTRADVLHARWSAGLEEYARVLLRLGEFERARVLLRGFLGEQPYRERAWAQLMLACHGMGDTAGALDAYLRARTVLIRDYGIEPGPRLTGLHRAILRREPVLHADGWAPGWRSARVRRIRTRRLVTV